MQIYIYRNSTFLYEILFQRVRARWSSLYFSSLLCRSKEQPAEVTPASLELQTGLELPTGRTTGHRLSCSGSKQNKSKALLLLELSTQQNPALCRNFHISERGIMYWNSTSHYFLTVNIFIIMNVTTFSVWICLSVLRVVQSAALGVNSLQWKPSQNSFEVFLVTPKTSGSQAKPSLYNSKLSKFLDTANITEHPRASQITLD